MDNTAHKESVSALLAGAYEEDRLLVRDVFRKSGWRLFEAAVRRRATECLKRHTVHVVIVKSDMPDWRWQEALNHLRCLAHPPLLIVTSRTADEYLWAEVLNIGGWDVLSQPFERDEVVRVVASARRHFDRQPARVEEQLAHLATSAA